MGCSAVHKVLVNNLVPKNLRVISQRQTFISTDRWGQGAFIVQRKRFSTGTGRIDPQVLTWISFVRRTMLLMRKHLLQFSIRAVLDYFHLPDNKCCVTILVISGFWWSATTSLSLSESIRLSGQNQLRSITNWNWSFYIFHRSSLINWGIIVRWGRYWPTPCEFVRKVSNRRSWYLQPWSFSKTLPGQK